MQIRVLIWTVLLAFASTGVALAQVAGGLKPGSVLVARVAGTVQMVDKDGTVTPKLERGMQVKESATIKTLGASSVVLVFSNGATTQLGADTELVLEQYLQGEFTGEVSPSKITEEPSVSKTRLFLNRGELIGNVKKLRKPDSEFEVRTPVGAAGIRGTTFRIVFTPTGTGAAFLTSPWLFQLSTQEGEVTFDPASRGAGTGGPPAPGGPPPVDVNGGVQIVLTVTVQELPSGQYQVAVTPVVQSPVPIPPQILVQFERAAAEIAVAAERALFTSGGTSSGTVTGAFTPEPRGGGASGDAGTTPPPPQEPEPPRTTPGTG